MSGSSQSNKPRSNRQSGKPRSKSGCKTCKIRKVKCDEGRPACIRCVSTGRVCDGYGIWGGGGTVFDNCQSSVSKVDTLAIWSSTRVSILAGTMEEKRYFEWFLCRTAKKLPGLYPSNFWAPLIYQASFSEPAVLHAVLALSSLHKRDIFYGNYQKRSDQSLDQQEQFMLRHYGRAIRLLQPHFLMKDRESVRIALITCVIFICIETLRGHFTTAETHLQHGLKILRDSQTTSKKDNGPVVLRPGQHPIDNWILEIFSRLKFSKELFKQDYDQNLDIDLSRPVSSSTIFPFFHEAWMPLERVFRKTDHLTKLNLQEQCAGNPSIKGQTTLIVYQQEIQAELDRWFTSFEASEAILQAQNPDGFACRIIRQYHTMASIMLGTCMHPGDESVFDLFTEEFIFIISQAAIMWKISYETERLRTLPGPYMDMSRSMIDIGWIPPLHYVARKCRVHRIRLQAVRLLESASHREGIWDSKVAATMARKMMEAEERNFYKEFNTVDDFLLSSLPCQRDLSLPSLPQSYRISKFDVVRPNSLMDEFHILFKQRQEDGTLKEFRIPIGNFGNLDI